MPNFAGPSKPSLKPCEQPEWTILQIGSSRGNWLCIPEAIATCKAEAAEVWRLRGLWIVAVVVLLALCLSSVDAAVDTVHNTRTSDRDLAERKVQCYQDIDSGLWGDACRASPIDKENCALSCVSSTCYESVYGVDPLEEGEIDLRRGRQFKACIRGQSKAERMAKVKGASIY